PRDSESDDVDQRGVHRETAVVVEADLGWIEGHRCRKGSGRPIEYGNGEALGPSTFEDNQVGAVTIDYDVVRKSDVQYGLAEHLRIGAAVRYDLGRARICREPGQGRHPELGRYAALEEGGTR